MSPFWANPALAHTGRPVSKAYKCISVHKHTDSCSNTGAHPKTNAQKLGDFCTHMHRHTCTPHPSSFAALTPTPTYSFWGLLGLLCQGAALFPHPAAHGTVHQAPSPVSFSSSQSLFVRLKVPGATSQGAWSFQRSWEWLSQPCGDLLASQSWVNGSPLPGPAQLPGRARSCPSMAFEKVGYGERGL